MSIHTLSIIDLYLHEYIIDIYLINYLYLIVYTLFAAHFTNASFKTKCGGFLKREQSLMLTINVNANLHY